VPVLSKLIAQRGLPKLWQTRARLVELFDEERDPGEAGAAGAPGV
jgi:hypothetical protein